MRHSHSRVKGWFLEGPPKKHFEIFRTPNIPPDSYLVEIYTYPFSSTVIMTLDDEEYKEFEKTMPEKDYDEAGNLTLVNYIIRLSPLKSEPEMPHHSGSWLDTFTFR